MSAFCREHDNKLYVTSVVPRRFLVQKILLIQLIIFNPVSFIYISYRFSGRAVVLGRTRERKRLAEYASNMAADLSILIVQMRKFLCLKKLKGQLIARLIWKRFHAQIIIVQIVKNFS